MIARTDISYCSACFQAKPGTPHVDFEAAWDGPVEVEGEGKPITHAIDELVICEDCLAQAAETLGYVKSDLTDRVKELEQAVVEQTRRAFQAEQALDVVRGALPDVAPVPAPPRRGPGRPRKQPQPQTA